MKGRGVSPNFRTPLLLGLLTALIFLAFPLPTAASTRTTQSAPIGLTHVPGWTVDKIYTLRAQSNWEAWRTSHVSGRYFYHGSWQAIGRRGGWFELFQLDQGAAHAQTAVLVSRFDSTVAAQRAYRVMLPHTSQLTALAIGTQAAQWQTNVGVASGPQGLVGYFGGFTTYLLSGRRVIEIHADVGGTPHSVLRPPLPNPGISIARRLA